MKYRIYRHPEGIGLNGKEFVLDNKGEYMLFNTIDNAVKLIADAKPSISNSIPKIVAPAGTAKLPNAVTIATWPSLTLPATPSSVNISLYIPSDTAVTIDSVVAIIEVNHVNLCDMNQLKNLN